MTTLEKVKNDVAGALTKALAADKATGADELLRPPQADMGDLSYPCFEVAKLLKQSPAAIAKSVAEKIKLPDLVASARAVGPYVNFYFDRPTFGAAVLKEVLEQDVEYGSVGNGGKKGRVMIEYGSLNTHKEVHVGHLRNLSLGLALERILRASGENVIAVNYIGDVGAHVAKWLWYFDKARRGEIPGAILRDEDVKEFGKIYTDATLLAEKEPEKSAAEISEVLQALERQDPEWERLWIRTRDACLAQMRVIFTELGVNFERTFLESEVEQPGKALVKDLLAKGIAKLGERGALIVDLEDQGLGVFLVLKSDGTALYSTKELALAQMKLAEFPDVKKNIHVVDNRQSLYFKQFFATLKRMGFEQPMIHLGYEFVTLKEGAMSSRKGNIVTYEEFRDAMIRMVSAGTASRHPEWDKAKIGEVAWTIAEGAMKFWMLKQDNDRPLTFDMEAATSFDGFTGPYVQYAYARLSSILMKADAAFVPAKSVTEKKEDDAEVPNESVEHSLLRTIAEFPNVVLSAAKTYRPSLLTQYMFDLAQASNAFYRDVPVLATKDKEERAHRLAIVAACRTTISSGLNLLGIRVNEIM